MLPDEEREKREAESEDKVRERREVDAMLPDEGVRMGHTVSKHL